MKITIKQGYIHAEKNKQIRIRLSKWLGEEFVNICVKYTGRLVRDEFEFSVYKLKEAKELYKKCDWTLEKLRLSFDANNVHYDVDTYPNGLNVAEVEFKSIRDMKKWVKPSWIGKEITGVAKYSNIILAKKNLKFK